MRSYRLRAPSHEKGFKPSRNTEIESFFCDSASDYSQAKKMSKQNLNPRDLVALLQKGEPIRIIDVRTPIEYRGGHIPGAVNIPLGTFHSEFPGVDLSETVVVVCKWGGRSSAACEQVGANYAQVFNLAGGTEAWMSEGFEIESAAKDPRSVDRQVHFVAGLLLVSALLLGASVNAGWFYLAALPAFGLMLDAISGFCPMTFILKKMPWNQTS